MLSWICPDCGCDCAPSEHECPDCSDLVQAGMLALARAVQTHVITAPPPVEIPLQQRVPGGLQTVAPRTASQAGPREIEVLPQAAANSAPLMPISSSGIMEVRIPEPHVVAPQSVAVPTAETQIPPEVAVAPSAAPVAPAAKPAAAPAPRAKVPGWLLSLVVATALSLGGAAIVRNMAQENRSDAAPAPEAQAPSSPQAAFARYVEVTGLRVMVDLQRNSQLRYIVVNHSSTLLSNVALHVSVHSGSASGKALFSTSALVTGLGPFESREMVTDIEDMRVKDIPEWDRLKPVVQVITQ